MSLVICKIPPSKGSSPEGGWKQFPIQRITMMEANKGNRKEFNIVPIDFDCNLLGPSSSGGSRGSILGPSRLEAEGDLLVC